MDIYNTVCIVSIASLYIVYRKELHRHAKNLRTKLVARTGKYIQAATLKFVKVRSNYVWTERNRTSPMVRSFLDRVLIVDPTSASLNSSQKASERVGVFSAMLSRGAICMDVTDRMQNILVDFDDPFMGDNGQITIDIEDVAPSLVGPDGGEFWYLDVTYRGHSDAGKRIEAQTYSVRYKAKWGEFVTFPPYSLNDKPSRGLGSKKIVSAECLDGIDIAHLAKQYAGLKTNFYADCPDEVLKNHMHIEAHVTLSKGVKCTVTRRS